MAEAARVGQLAVGFHCGGGTSYLIVGGGKTLGS